MICQVRLIYRKAIMICITMKHILLSVPLVLFSTVFLQAQSDLHFGAKIGANLNNVKITLAENPFSSETPNTEYALGYQAGCWLNLPVSPKVNFRWELAYSSERYKTDSTGSKVIFNYLDLDLLVGYRLLNNLSIEIGQGIGKMLSAKWTVDDHEFDLYDDYETGFDVSLNFGMVYHLHPKLSIGLRYNQGLDDLSEQIVMFSDSDGQRFEIVDVKEVNRNFQLNLYYSFNAKRE